MMKRFLRRTLFCLVPATLAAFVVGARPAAAQDYAVGGGQGTFLGCLSNVVVSAHSAADAPTTGVGGTYNVTLSGTPATCAFPESHFVSTVDCLRVGDDDNGPGTAQATAVITYSDGFFATILPAGSEVRVDVFDSGMPGGMGDKIGASAASGPCDFTSGGAYCFGVTPCSVITNGNFVVHDG